MNKNEIQKGRVRARQTLDGFAPASDRSARSMAAQPAQPVASAVQPTARKIATSPTAKYYPLPAYELPNHPAKPFKKRSSRKVLVLRGVSLVLAMFLATGGFLTWKGVHQLHKVFHGTTTVAALTEQKVAPYQLNGEGDGRINILLLSVGGSGHTKPDRTDTMVVLSIDPVNSSAALLSVPQDLWVHMPVNYVGSSQKINAAYESGKYAYLGHMDSSNANAAAVQAGFVADDQVIKDVLGLTINYHVLMNFQAFRQAVDTVGGVTINVPQALVDPSMAWENGGDPVLATAGAQQMDSTKALQYVRSRKTSSDLGRTERQRQVLVALKDKALTAGTLTSPAKIDKLLNAFGDNASSDLSTQGAMRLFGLMSQIGNKVSSISLSDPNHQLVVTDHVGNTSILRPVAGLYAYDAIQSYVRASLPDGYIVREHAPVAVYGATVAGANATSVMLSDYGYRVVSANSAGQVLNTPVVVDLSRGQDPYTLHYLEQHYGVTAVTRLPVGISLPDPGAKFVILDTK